MQESELGSSSDPDPDLDPVPDGSFRVGDRGRDMSGSVDRERDMSRWGRRRYKWPTALEREGGG